MKKIYRYYCLLFFGSILPFLIVETYFLDYMMIGYLVLLASVVLTSCFIVEYVKTQTVPRMSLEKKNLGNIRWNTKDAGQASSYYFRNYW